MKFCTKYILCIVFYSGIFCSFAFAQNDNICYAKYFVQFVNKWNSAYSINRPEEFLSPKAIEKRERMNIPITESDLPVNTEYIKKVLELDSSIRVINTSKWFNSITIYCEKAGISDKIQSLPCVSFCEKTVTLKEPEPVLPNYTYKAFGQTRNNSDSARIMSKQIKYGKSEKQIRLNNMQWIHLKGFTGKGISIMITDGGFKNADSIRHLKYLREEGRIKDVRNYATNYANPFRDGNHGTYVLSCISSFLQNELIGTAPEADIYLAQTENNCFEALVEEDNWISAAEWADSLGCDIISSSLSYSTFDDSTTNHFYSETDGKSARISIAAKMASDKGIIVCTSAGNQGSKKWKFVGFPSEAKGVITVGAAGPNKQKMPFSSKGPCVDGRIKPDAVAMGYETQVGTPWNKTAPSTGTSFSTPLIAGMIACLKQAFPKVKVSDFIEIIHKSGNCYSSPDSSLGYGITDMLKAYNILANLNFDTAEIKIYTLQTTCNDNTCDFYISAKNDKSVNLEFKLYRFDKDYKIVTNNCKTLKMKVKKGFHHVDVLLPDEQVEYSMLEINMIIKSEKGQQNNDNNGEKVYRNLICFDPKSLPERESINLPEKIKERKIKL